MEIPSADDFLASVRQENIRRIPRHWLINPDRWIQKKRKEFVTSRFAFTPIPVDLVTTLKRPHGEVEASIQAIDSREVTSFIESLTNSMRVAAPVGGSHLLSFHAFGA
jgi:hypothetical protein